MAVLLLALALVGFGAGPAAAHAAVLSTTPSAGAALDTAPTSVSVQFSESVQAASDAIRVLDAHGARVDQGGAATEPGRSDTVAVAVRPGLAQGTYTVAWHVTSADSHPVHGAFAFAVGRTGAVVAPLADADRGATSAVTTLVHLARGFGYAGLALLVGAVGIGVLLDGDTGRTGVRDLLGRQARAGGLVLTVSAAVDLLAQGPYAAGAGLGSLFDPTLLHDTLSGRTGVAEALRVVLAAGLTLALGAGLPAARRPAEPAGVPGGLGSPEVSGAPESPGAPEAPVSGGPESPDAPEAPEVSSAPELSGAPARPEAPDSLESPEAPALVKAPEPPERSGSDDSAPEGPLPTSDTPEAAATPEAAEGPAAPGAPEPPATAEAAAAHGAVTDDPLPPAPEPAKAAEEAAEARAVGAAPTEVPPGEAAAEAAAAEVPAAEAAEAPGVDAPATVPVPDTGEGTRRPAPVPDTGEGTRAPAPWARTTVLWARVAPYALFPLLVGLAATFSVTSHAATGRHAPVAFTMDLLHLMAMGLWLGGLVALAVLCTNRAVTADPGTPSVFTATVRRFSPLAAWCVGVLVVTGTLQAIRLLGSVGDMVTTGWGRYLTVKLTVILVLLALARTARGWTHRYAPARRRAARLGRLGRPGPLGRPEQPDEPHRLAPSNPSNRPDPSDQLGPSDPSNRPDPSDQLAPSNPSNRPGPSDQLGPSDRPDRSEHPGRPDRPDRPDRPARSVDSEPGAGGAPAPSPLRAMRRTLAAEACVGAVVLALSTMLASSAPPADRAAGRVAAGSAAASASGSGSAAAPAAPAHLHTTYDTGDPGGSGTAVAVVTPQADGTVAIDLTLTTAGGAPAQPAEFTAALSLPSLNIGPLPLDLDQTAPGRWQTTTTPTPKGKWQLALTIRTSDVDETTVTFPATTI